MHLFGVCDGHGPKGELVSGYIARVLPEFLIDFLRQVDSNPTDSLRKTFELVSQNIKK